METYISDGSKYRKRLSMVVSGDSGSMNEIILEMIVCHDDDVACALMTVNKTASNFAFEAVLYFDIRVIWMPRAACHHTQGWR